MARDILEKAGRLTSGNAPLHERRKPIADLLDQTTLMIRTMMANWPNEYEFPVDHDIHELLEVMDVVGKSMEEDPDAKTDKS